MERTITSLTLNISSINSLRIDPADGITPLFDLFVQNLAFTFNDEHQQIGRAALLPLNTSVQILTASVDLMCGRIKIPIRHDWLPIDLHPIILGRLTQRVQESSQCSLGSCETSLIVEDKNAPSLQRFRLVVSSVRGLYTCLSR